jgi:hypothetical protein
MRLINRPWSEPSFLEYDSNVGTGHLGKNFYFEPTDGNNDPATGGPLDNLAILNHAPGSVEIDMHLASSFTGPKITHIDHP